MDRTAVTPTAADTGATSGGLPGAGAALLRSLGPARILALGLVACALLGFFALIVFRAIERPYSLLFGALEPTDARELITQLESMGVPYRLTPAGDALLVPADDAPGLRMSLAERGLPTGGTVGNELLDTISGLTTTDFLADVNLRRAVEGELARSIASLRPVRQARVHVVWPKRDLFRRDGEQASAAVVLALRGSEALVRSQIAGIRHLVAGAIPGLSPGQVSIVDERGNLLARPDGRDASGGSIDEVEEHRAAFEQRVRTKIRDLLERSVGPGRVEVEISADFDFDDVETTVESFDPESQVARSTQAVEEDEERSESDAADVSVANNLPVEDEAAPEPGTSQERTRRSEETANYEISRTVTSQRRRAPLLRRLSIAVQVDAINRAPEGQPPVYEPRSAEEMAQLEALVRGAAGVDDERGDVVSVVSRELALVVLPVEDAAQGFSLADATIWRVIELATLALLTLAMIFLGVRPALRRLLPAPSALIGPAGVTGAAEAGSPAIRVETEASAAGDPLRAEAATNGTGQSVANQSQQLQGLVRASLIEEIGQLVDGQPDEAVRVVRSWLSEA